MDDDNALLAILALWTAIKDTQKALDCSAWPSLECSLGSLSSHLSKGLGCWEVMSTYCSCVLKSSRGDVQEQHRVKMVTGGGRACNSQFASDAWFAFPN
jgi:hypothetical protein